MDRARIYGFHYSDTGTRLGKGWIPVLFLFLFWGRESKAGEEVFIWLTILGQSSLL